VLFATESHAVALEYLDGLRREGVATLLNDGREVLGRVRQGGTIPLFMTMGHVGDSPERTFCAVLRDITAFKLAERELVEARRAAEASSAHKTDFLAKISHEIRTALNAIIGFAEVMMEERFGPVGNERYKDYLRDIHGSGRHVVSLVNDLLDLAKIESGHMELAFTSVGLNELVAGTVALLQPQATRARIIMRTSFAPKLPPVVADERSVRQIVLNLVSNAIKFTGAGGQVIVSTVMTERGEVAFRVRDTGIGMSEQDLVAALEPFRQISSSPDRSGTGLGLPLTKALVDANRAALHITSARGSGTLAEVLFPPTRVLAD
jgi:signal transduction histidine kinase